ncbi:uncharacterized protein LOC143919635 isoform X2 [Arctopsyche grandis]|uniref:uncharacterized protein LOC143919635 isoform X2 n=1 Tax=Arctopsyche grandis TaxID=121162 RepID=UPI00406D72A5
MNNKKLLHHYQNSTIGNASSNIRYNGNGSLSKHYHSNLNNGRSEVPPYVDVVGANRPTLSTFSSNRKKRKWDEDNSERVSLSIDQYDEEPTRYIDGIPAALRGEDGTYRRLHEHNITSNSEDDDSYDSSSPEWNSLRKNSKGFSCKWIMFIFLLVFLVTMNIPFYNQVNSRSGSVPGWSYNTSRDTRSYVLPDNITILNQPKSTCKLTQDIHKNKQPPQSKMYLKDDGDEIFLLVIVCSSMDHFEARSAIRDTWGNQTNYESLARKLQNVTAHYRNVNVTYKMLNEFSDIGNISLVDRRTKRDLNSETYYDDNHYVDSDASESDGNLQFDLVLNYTASENNSDSRELSMELSDGDLNRNSSIKTDNKFSPDKAVLANDLYNSVVETDNQITQSKHGVNSVDSVLTVNRSRLKRDVKPKSVQKRDESDDHRFVYDDNGSDQTHTDAAYVDDGRILGNFEGNDAEKNDNIDFYDYQTEVSNIMRIPPKGEKFSDSEDLTIAKDNVNKILKLSVSGDKLKLESQTVKNLARKNVENETVRQSNMNDTRRSVKYDPPVKIRYLFLLGQWSNENNTDLQAKIDEESALYGDIIQEGFIDSYNNLTLKSLMLLKWVISNCGDNVRYIMKTDDDMYVNIPRLVEALQNKSKEYLHRVSSNFDGEYMHRMNSTTKQAILKDEKLLMGDLICDARPISDTSSKWYSPTYMFGGKVYPRYLSGTGYVMSLGAAKLLYRAALDTPLFHLEDIYITGMCSMKAGIKPVDHPGFSYSVRKFDPCVFTYLITAHQVSPPQLRRMHSTLNSPSVILDSCEVKHILANKNSSFLSNVKDILLIKSSLTLGSPKSFINGLANLGMVDNKMAKLGTVVTKKRKRPNNGCF